MIKRDALARQREAALERVAEYLAELEDLLAQTRRHAAEARAHLAAIKRGEPGDVAPPLPTEAMR
jgi:hypothetical protein